MTRDYKKSRTKTTRKRNATRRKKSMFPTRPLIIVSIILFGFGGFLTYLKFNSATSPNALRETQQAAKKVEQPVDQKQIDVPEYTFHELLNDKEVVIDEKSIEQSNSEKNIQYLMPCGSFRNMDIADALKAKIAFLGIESKIIPVDVESGTWYRVQLGPYTSKRRAESVRHKLQLQDINDCRIWSKRL
ncbi:MAG: SPOR domain-containing protein [Kangiellaceae bacterium]|jgi:cell division protein FtsN|nr:SPOR domain-containing protein [Kangiellaceae bacterium]